MFERKAKPFLKILFGLFWAVTMDLSVDWNRLTAQMPPSITILSTDPDVLTRQSAHITIQCAFSSLQSGGVYKTQIYLNSQMIKSVDVPGNTYILSIEVDIPPLLIPMLMDDGQTNLQVRAVLTDSLVPLSSATSLVPITSPVPLIVSMDPPFITVGSSDFNLSLIGSGFTLQSTASWNGTALKTTFVSITRLKIAITSQDIAAAGNVRITVYNPPPGGGTSNERFFPVSIPGATTTTTTTTATTTTLLFLPLLHRPV